MNHDKRAPNSAPDSRVEMDHGLAAVAQAGVEPGATAMPSDRLYQLAAMTAGIILLATLL